MKTSLKTNLPFLMVAVFLLLIAVLLAWHVRQRELEFTAYQYGLMEASVTGASSEVRFLIDAVQTSLGALAERYHKELQTFATNPSQVEQYDHVHERIAEYYPELVAFTVADREGTLFYDDLGERVGELCRADIRKFAHDNQFLIYIHPGPAEHHFDVMLPWVYGKGEKGVFFASFKPEMVARILETSELPAHRLIVVRNDVEDLIEITSQGGRPQLTRDILLSRKERDRVTHQKAIPHTRWTLVDLPDENLFSLQNRKTRYEAIATFFGFVALSVLMQLLIKRAESQRTRAERALRKSRDDLETANERIARGHAHLQAHIRDLHDDVGAKLLTLTHRCKDLANAETARSALMDLRETIHDLGKQGTTVSLEDILADLRAEVRERLEAASIELHWRQSEQLTVQDYVLGFRQRSDLARIVREMLSNAIRHTQATAMRIECLVGEDGLRILLCNNGPADKIADWRPGTGMKNMRRRAHELGGNIEWYQSPASNSGATEETCVQVTCPLQTRV